MSPQTVAVVGLGLLGRGIAACLLGHGFRVIGYAPNPEECHQAESTIGRSVREMAAHGIASREICDSWRERWMPVQQFESLSGCDLVLESVVEDIDVKREVFDRIEMIVAPTTPIASNTSALPITLLQRERKHPERLLGAHWAEPAHATRFLELIRGEQTTDPPFEMVLNLARRIGKEPSIVRKDTPAFIVNRIGYAMYREALLLLEEEVADAESIDTACRNAFGLWASACGPFRWIDITGGPVLYAKAMRSTLVALGLPAKLPRPIEELERAGALGVRNGRGFYQYTEDEAYRWETLYRDHAWKVTEWLNEEFPQSDKPEEDSRT